MALSLPDYRHFPPLELLTIAVIMVVFIILIIMRLPGISADAEKASFNMVLKQLQNATEIRAGTLLIMGNDLEVTRMAGTNPVRLLSEAGYGPPANYLGELDETEESNITGYQWYFDRGRNLLVYRVYNQRYIQTPRHNDFIEIPFKLTLRYADRNFNSHFDKGIDVVEGLTFEATQDYRWLDRPTAK